MEVENIVSTSDVAFALVEAKCANNIPLVLRSTSKLLSSEELSVHARSTRGLVCEAFAESPDGAAGGLARVVVVAVFE